MPAVRDLHGVRQGLGRGLAISHPLQPKNLTGGLGAAKGEGTAPPPPTSMSPGSSNPGLSAAERRQLWRQKLVYSAESHRKPYASQTP